MCADQWEARECQVARQVLRQEWDRKVFGKSNANYQSLSFLFLFFTGVFSQILSNFY
jgi:hypothetical protein